MVVPIAELVPAVAYLRMSSEMQEDSIEQQRPVVYDYAKKNGYEIIREYVDPAVSGLKSRKNFERMVRDSHKRDFKAVICWDVARFARLDPISAASYKDTLRKNGVHLSTVKQGKQDWESTTGQIVDAIHQGQANEYSKGLSKDSIRGRLRRLEEGCWPNGAVPYGYDRLFIDNVGGTHLATRLGKFTKGRGWALKLVKNEQESKVVLRIFTEFIDKDVSMRGIAAMLNKDGVLRPDGNPAKFWSKDGVRSVLINKAYAGFAGIGGVNGKLRAKEAEVLNRAGYHEKEGSVPAIVSLDWWQKAQAKIKQRRDEHTAPQTNKSSVLSGVLFCGHCGYRLSKHERTLKKDGSRPIYFTCDNAIMRPGSGCKQWRVMESEVLPLVIEQLVKLVDKHVLEALDARPEDPTTDQIVNLQERLKQLDADLIRGNERYMKAPDEQLPRLQAMLADWYKEEQEIKKQLDKLTRTDGEITEFARWWETVKDNLVEVLPGKPVYASDPNAESAQWDETDMGVVVEKDRLRGILKDLGCKLVLYWRPKVVTRKGRSWVSTRNYEIDRARLEAGFNENELADGSNSCNHANTPDTHSC